MSQARRRAAHSALCIGILVLFGIVLFPLLGDHRVYRTATYIDVNSGDLRTETTICSFRVSDGIRATQFSQEVRGLGIPIPANRAWQPVVTTGLTGPSVGHTLSSVIGQCELLMAVFGQEEVSDEERLVILKSTLGSLKKGNLAEREIEDQLRALLSNGK